MNPARASIGKQMFLLKKAKSITAWEITEKEQGADHCNVGNQQAAFLHKNKGNHTCPVI